MESAIDQIMDQLKNTEIFSNGNLTFSLSNMDILVRQDGELLHIRTRPDGWRRYTVVYTWCNEVHYFPVRVYPQEKVIVLLKELLEFLTFGKQTKGVPTFLGLLSGKIRVEDVASSLTPSSSGDVNRGLTLNTASVPHLERNEHLLNELGCLQALPNLTSEELNKAVDRLKGPTGFLRSAFRRRRDAIPVVAGGGLLQVFEQYVNGSPKEVNEHLGEEWLIPNNQETRRPRHEFKNDEEYIQYLEHLISRSRVFPRVTTKPLSGPDHISRMHYMTGATEPSEAPQTSVKNEVMSAGDAFASQMKDGHYVPLEDEPSPFTDANLWTEWKKKQLERTGYTGPVNHFAEPLMRLLENEPCRCLALLCETVAFVASVPDAEWPTLGHVIHMRYTVNFNCQSPVLSWLEAHAVSYKQARHAVR